MVAGYIIALLIGLWALAAYLLRRRRAHGSVFGGGRVIDPSTPDPARFIPAGLRPPPAETDPDPVDRPALRPYEQEIIERRAREGRRVRLAGAVYDGALQQAGLERIIIEGGHRGEQGKAIRVLMAFFTPAEAVPVLTRALARHGPGFADLARFQIRQAGQHASFRPALEAATLADEGWLLALLPFASAPTQRAIGEALAKVGTADTLAALRALPAHTRPPPWMRETIAALRARLAEQRGGRLTLASSSDAAGGLSPADQPSAQASDSPR